MRGGVTDAGELQSLTALGITSISLVGSGNTGESIAGSAVVNRTSYTTSAGTVGQVASVDLATNATGDVFTTATSGVTITSASEGGPTPTTSFVDHSASAQSYTLSGGTLTDQTSGGNTVGTGLSAVFLTTQGGSITVSPTDTTSYWLGGGSGAGTLTGGAGNTVFLVNAKTVVHGGTGFNIAEVTDSQPANIDLMKENLQEVIGGQNRLSCAAAPLIRLIVGLAVEIPTSPSVAARLPRGNFHDQAFAVCSARLKSIGKATVIDRWRAPPVPPDLRPAIARYISLSDSKGTRVIGFVAHRNPNETETIIVRIRFRHTQTESWVVFLRGRQLLRMTADVYATGVGFSESASNGVDGLYFCGIRGPGPQWIWNGSAWK